MSYIEIIRLIGHHDHRLARPAQHLCHTCIQIGPPVHHINHKKNHIGFINGNTYLFVDLILHDIIRIYYPTAGIYQGKLLSIPAHLPVLAVASSTRYFRHNGLSSLSQAIKQGGFPHIGASHDCY